MVGAALATARRLPLRVTGRVPMVIKPVPVPPACLVGLAAQAAPPVVAAAVVVLVVAVMLAVGLTVVGVPVPFPWPPPVFQNATASAAKTAVAPVEGVEAVEGVGIFNPTVHRVYPARLSEEQDAKLNFWN